MKTEIINFLEEYKILCIKHKLEILGFDDGAFVVELDDDKYNLECLGFEEKHYSDGSIGMSNLGFMSKTDFKNSVMGIKKYISSTQSIKDGTHKETRRSNK